MCSTFSEQYVSHFGAVSRVDVRNSSDVHNILSPCYATHYASNLCDDYSADDVTDIDMRVVNHLVTDNYALQIKAVDFLISVDTCELRAFSLDNTILDLDLCEQLRVDGHVNVTDAEFLLRFTGQSTDTDSVLFHLEITGIRYLFVCHSFFWIYMFVYQQ